MGAKATSTDRLIRWIDQIGGLERWRAVMRRWHIMSKNERKEWDVQQAQSYPEGSKERAKIEAQWENNGIRNREEVKNRNEAQN